MSAFDGLRVRGSVTETWLRGRRIATADGGVVGAEGQLAGRPVLAAETPL